MKKLILTLSILLYCVASFAQWKTVSGSWQKNDSENKWRFNGSSNGIFAVSDSIALATDFNGNRPITLNVSGFNGLNVGTNTNVADFLNALFYPSQVPTASISGGSNRELASTGTTNVSVNWTAGRQAYTQPLSTVVVDGENQSFTQPSAPGSTGGTKAITLTNNTNKSVMIVVTTTDGKTANASTSFNWLPSRYWGRTANETANSSDLLTASGGGTQLSNSRNGTFTVNASGTNRIFFAYPANLGDLVSINIGGLESLSAFTKNIVNFTNSSGYTQNYNVYTSINPTGGNATFLTQ